MADLIKLKDGKFAVLNELSDLYELMDTYMGDEARRWMEDYQSEEQLEAHDYDLMTKEYESELSKQKEHHEEVMQELRKQSEQLANHIQQKELDRSAISAIAGKIGTITWREL